MMCIVAYTILHVFILCMIIMIAHKVTVSGVNRKGGGAPLQLVFGLSFDYIQTTCIQMFKRRKGAKTHKQVCIVYDEHRPCAD